MIRKVELVKAVYRPRETFPEPRMGDVAFVGRSNVGKSTLLNILFGRKIAHVSKKPGKTRSINFYLVNSSFYMVDLPGYGYASVSKEERRRWSILVEDYFSRRWSLKMVFVLMDGRHGLTVRDKELIEWLKLYDLPFAVILTKMDKVRKSERRSRLDEFESDLSEYGSYILIPYSSVTKEGVDEIVRLAVTAVGMMGGRKDGRAPDSGG